VGESAPLNDLLFAQKSIIICSARMRCKDNQKTRDNTSFLWIFA
jgi:hypothetical protein